MIEQSKPVFQQLDDDEGLLTYFMRGLVSGSEDFLLIGPMGAAIAHEHAAITKLSEKLHQLLQAIEAKVLEEMQVKTSLEMKLRNDFGDLLKEYAPIWAKEAQSSYDKYEAERCQEWNTIEREWKELSSLFKGERALETSDQWSPLTHEIDVPTLSNNPNSSGLPPAILFTKRNTYLPRQDGQILVQPSSGGNDNNSKHWPNIVNIFVWRRLSLVNLIYEDFTASLHPIQEGDGRSRQPSDRKELTILASTLRGQRHYPHLKMMVNLEASIISPSALLSPPVVFLPIDERHLAIIHGANWDNSVVVGNMEDGSSVLRFIHHKDVVTCLSLSSDGRTLISGSKDGSLAIWEVKLPETKQQGLFSGIFSGKELPVPILSYRFTLVGHDDAITCCDHSSHLNLCASGSADGSALIFDLDACTILASLNYGNNRSVLHTITHIKLIGSRDSATGERVGKVFSYCAEQKLLYLHALDGRLLAMKQDMQLNSSGACVRCMAFTSDGRYAISGRSDGMVVLWNLDNLSLRDSMDIGSKPTGGSEGAEEVTAISLFEDRLLLVGLKGGALKTFPLSL